MPSRLKVDKLSDSAGAVDINVVDILTSTSGFPATSVNFAYTPVARSLEQWAQDIIKITDFGASVGSADNSAAIQAAIDFAYARGGGAVYIPGGAGTSSLTRAVYKVASTVILRPNVNLYGDGYSSTLQATTALSAVLMLQSTATSGIQGRFIRDISILGNNSSVGIACDQVSTDTSIKYLYGFTFHGVHVESASTGIQFQGLWHSTISNCTTSTCATGLHIWGQCVSLHITGSHFRKDNASASDTFGIRIQPRVYAWSPDQSAGSRSEAIIVDGETMCISVKYGIYVHDCLDLQLSNLDLDYIGQYGVVILNVNGGFSLRDSWIAADAAGTTQFIGVVFTTPTTIQQQKAISGLHINCNNAYSVANNIGISVAGAAPLSIRDCTFVDGWAGVYITDTNSVLLDGCIFGSCALGLNNTYSNTIVNCAMDSVVETAKPDGTSNFYRDNRGAANTSGRSQVTVGAAATSGSYAISNPSGLSFLVTKLGGDVSANDDRLSVSGSTVNCARPSAVAFAIPSPFSWTAL